MFLDEFVGKDVKVTLHREDPKGIVCGLLISVNREGEAQISVNGETRYCWPVLAIEDVNTGHTWDISK